MWSFISLPPSFFSQSLFWMFSLVDYFVLTLIFIFYLSPGFFPYFILFYLLYLFSLTLSLFLVLSSFFSRLFGFTRFYSLIIVVICFRKLEHNLVAENHGLIIRHTKAIVCLPFITPLIRTLGRTSSTNVVSIVARCTLYTHAYACMCIYMHAYIKTCKTNCV